MKRFFAPLIFLLSVVALCGCSKDETEEAYSLRGTVWQGYIGEVFKKLTFDSTECKCTYLTRVSTFTFTSSYNYELDYPKVYLHPTESGYAELEGTITDKQMSMLNVSTNENAGSLIEQ